MIKRPRCPLGEYCRKSQTEAGFRRGYQHGFLAALEAIEAGASLEEVRSHALHELQRWRWCRSRGRFDPPPEVLVISPSPRNLKNPVPIESKQGPQFSASDR